ncbi:hypothetical protein [Lentzea sp.]|uniref:hypothetical protein n=1 Tax=Lentzea sp. TaxID=56099 RepID=UPI002D00F8AB|nr:hypothetical protein [Lentzea sp.]HUQ54874.1 hypothetical protein [Lentzea sp.]
MAVAAVAVLTGALATTVSPVAVAAPHPSADLLAAMRRDLGLDARQRRNGCVRRARPRPCGEWRRASPARAKAGRGSTRPPASSSWA